MKCKELLCIFLLSAEFYFLRIFILIQNLKKSQLNTISRLIERGHEIAIVLKVALKHQSINQLIKDTKLYNLICQTHVLSR